MMVEALCCSRTSDEHRPTASRIVELILDDACSHFALGKYSSAEKNRRGETRPFPYSYWPQHISSDQKGERDADVVTDLYKQAQDLDPQKGYMLLDKIQTAAAEIPEAELNRLLIPLLQKLLGHTDSDSRPVRLFYQSTLETYLVRTVEYEPGKPANWDRSGEFKRCSRSTNCSLCDVLERFMAAPDLETTTIMWLEEYSHSAWNIPFWYEKTMKERTEDGARTESLTIQKTNKAWEWAKEGWDKRAEKARKALGCFPGEELRKLLGAKYDSIVNLDVVKLPAKRRDSAHGEEQGSAPLPKRQKTKSTG